MEARERTQRKCQELFQKFVTEGLTPDEAAARAIHVIRFGEDQSEAATSSAQSDPTAPEPMEVENITPISTDVKEFMEYMSNEDQNEVKKFIRNIFGSQVNLAASFKLGDDKSVDWDGLKRAYEMIEETGLDTVLVESINDLLKDVNKSSNYDMIVQALVMVSCKLWRFS